MGFDPTGRYLLTVSHAGRGVFDTHDWRLVARDYELAYPEDRIVEGIGPIAGRRLNDRELDSTRLGSELNFICRCAR